MSGDLNDTIAAISTALGEGGIGIVRVSGPGALEIADSVFRCSSKNKLSTSPSHTIHYGHVRHPKTGEVLDEALVSIMRAPRTYTREDLVEINCHGGGMSLKKTLDACLFAGARIAQPGEFTKRAFVNGRIDLAQAEAVMDIISSETEKAQKFALGQLEGGLSSEVEALRDELVGILALLELSLDFSQEDVEFPQPEEVSAKMRDVLSKLTVLLGTASGGMMLRAGASVVIAGKPNVGKSSLMNALLKHERVIVTPIAGTTRDVIEESINLNGIKIKLSDTAGIVDTKDRVEIEGIRRSREKLASADIVVFVIDSSLDITERDMGIYDAVKHKKTVIVLNKTDLGEHEASRRARKEFKDEEIVMVSALKKTGLEELEGAISRKLFSGSLFPSGESPVIMNARHKECIEKAECSTRRALDIFLGHASAEIVSIDIREAAHSLGLIVGKSIEDDVVERIFSKFCIGK